MSGNAPSSRTPASAEMKALMAEHADLSAAFLDQQAQLVEGDAEAAEVSLHAFRGRLGGHLVAEERVILPFYEGHVEAPKGGRVDYFRNEHVKLERQLAEAAAWMAAWRGGEWPAREVVLLIERQKVFKEIMEHHDERENHFLYPGIEDVTDAETRAGLTVAFRRVADEVVDAWSASPVGERPAGGGSDAGRGPVLDGGNGDGAFLPARVAAWSLACLEERVAALAASRERPRAPAPWADCRQRLADIRRGLAAAEEPRRTAALVDAATLLLVEVTPIKRFPVARAAEVQSSWHLLQACGRAARSRG